MKFPAAPDYLCFPLFSTFAIPMMVCIQTFLYFSMCVTFLGMFRPGSRVARETQINHKNQMRTKETIKKNKNKLGRVTYWEWMVIILFGSGIILFFTRTPQIFTGWGDVIEDYLNLQARFIKDSAVAMTVVFGMFLLPSKATMWDYWTAKYMEDLPTIPISPILHWREVTRKMPFNYMFLLGGGIALSRGADFSGLNSKLGDFMSILGGLPNLLTIFLVILIVHLINNFASNVAICNILSPIAMAMASKIHRNPLWYLCAAGYSTCFCYMIPVSTPGNLIVKSAAYIPTMKMVKAGALPSVGTVLFLWIFLSFYAPVVWPILNDGNPWWLNITTP